MDFEGVLVYTEKKDSIKIEKGPDMKKVYRISKEKKIAGVCAGLGEYFNLDPVLLRALFIILTFVGGMGILAYIIMWIVLPVQDQERNAIVTTKRLYLSTVNKKIAGVCGGLGEFFDLDPVFFRVGFLVLVFLGGAGILLYIILWMIVPRKEGPYLQSPGQL